MVLWDDLLEAGQMEAEWGLSFKYPLPFVFSFHGCLVKGGKLSFRGQHRILMEKVCELKIPHPSIYGSNVKATEDTPRL